MSQFSASVSLTDQQAIALAKDYFKKSDTDGDGTLTADEASAGIAKSADFQVTDYANRVERRVKDVVSLSDANGDKLLSQQELEAAFEKYFAGAAKTSSFKTTITVRDTPGGGLSDNELRWAFKDLIKDLGIADQVDYSILQTSSLADLNGAQLFRDLDNKAYAIANATVERYSGVSGDKNQKAVDALYGAISEVLQRDETVATAGKQFYRKVFTDDDISKISLSKDQRDDIGKLRSSLTDLATKIFEADPTRFGAVKGGEAKAQTTVTFTSAVTIDERAQIEYDKAMALLNAAPKPTGATQSTAQTSVTAKPSLDRAAADDLANALAKVAFDLLNKAPNPNGGAADSTKASSTAASSRAQADALADALADTAFKLLDAAPTPDGATKATRGQFSDGFLKDLTEALNEISVVLTTITNTLSALSKASKSDGSSSALTPAQRNARSVDDVRAAYYANIANFLLGAAAKPDEKAASESSTGTEAAKTTSTATESNKESQSTVEKKTKKTESNLTLEDILSSLDYVPDSAKAKEAYKTGYLLLQQFYETSGYKAKQTKSV